MWISKVTGTAQALGLRVWAVPSLAKLRELAEKQKPTCVILDLATAGVDWADAVAQLREVCPAEVRLVGYGSHVDLTTLSAARRAGCDAVLPRSKMAESLPELLSKWLARPTPNTPSRP